MLQHWWADLAINARVLTWDESFWTTCNWAQLPWDTSRVSTVCSLDVATFSQRLRLRRGEWIWPDPHPIYISVNSCMHWHFTWTCDFNTLSFAVAMTCMYRWIIHISTGVSLSRKRIKMWREVMGGEGKGGNWGDGRHRKFEGDAKRGWCNLSVRQWNL